MNNEWVSEREREREREQERGRERERVRERERDREIRVSVQSVSLSVNLSVSQSVTTFNDLPRAADKEVHLIYINRVIKTCSLELSFQPKTITHYITINFKKVDDKISNEWGHPPSWLVINIQLFL